jgi:hypothetical protein
MAVAQDDRVLVYYLDDAELRAYARTVVAGELTDAECSAYVGKKECGQLIRQR